MKKLMLIMCVLLVACHPSDDALQTAAQVAPWVQQVKLNAEQQAVAAPHDTALFSAQLPTHLRNVFVPMATLPIKPAPAPQDKVNLLPFVDEPPMVLAPPLLPQKNIDLSQAGASELKYVGLLSHDGTTTGMVKVLARLYPVHVGDKIGAGQWSVLSLDAQKMQIKIAQKAVVYEKN